MSEPRHPGHETLGINRRNLDLVFAGYRPGRFRVLDDKLAAKERLTASGIPVPRTLGVLWHAPRPAEVAELLQPHSEIVIKPVRGSGGRGILVLHQRGGSWLDTAGEPLTIEAIANHVSDIVSGMHSLDESEDGALFEERVHPDPVFDGLAEGGLPDLRVVVEQGEPIQAMCRVPTSASDGKANLHSGGLGIGIDIETGVTTGGRWRGKPLDRHPDCGVALAGIQIPHWPRILDIARAAGSAVGLSYLGVDLVLDRDRGPLVLEVNARPGLEIQVVNRAPQPVQTRTLLDALDRLTLRFAWAVLALMAIGPFLFERWQPSTGAVEVIRLSHDSARDEAETGENPVRQGVEWASEEIPVSTISEPFRAAREAGDRGDLAEAVELYRRAAADTPSIAPFAKNNIALLLREQGRPEEAREALQEALAEYPEYFRALYNLGLVHLDLEDYEAAQRCFEGALAQRPSHAPSWAGLGSVHFSRREFAAAIEAYEQAIRFDPPNRAYRVREGLAFRLQGDTARAAERFAEAWTLDPGHEPAIYWWARTVLEENAVAPDSVATVLAQHAQGRESSARCLSLAADTAWRTGELSQSWRWLQELTARRYRTTYHRRASAVVALELGLFDAAAVELNELSADENTFVRRELELATLGSNADHEDLRDATSSLEIPEGGFRTPTARWLHEAISNRQPEIAAAPRTLPGVLAEWLVRPDRPLPAAWPDQLPTDRISLSTRVEANDPLPSTLVLWLVLRRAEQRAQDEVAREALAALQRTAPSYHPLEQRRLRRAVREGDTRAALEVARSLRRLWKDDPENTLVLASLYVDTGRASRAEALIGRLPAEQRRAIPARTLRARILLEQGEVAEARRELQRLVSEAPSDAQVRVILAEAHRAGGDARDAIAQLEAALDLAPTRLDVRRDLGRLLMDAHRYPQAVEVWRKVITLDATDDRDRFNLALSLQRNGDLLEAIAQYDLLLTEDPTRYKAWFNRSLALEDLGRTDESRAGYEKVLELRPDHEPALRKLGRVSRGD